MITIADVRPLSPVVLNCGEGPFWEPDNQTLYFTDSTGEELWQYSDRQVHSFFKGHQVGSIVAHEQGGWICSTNKGFAYLSPDKNFTYFKQEQHLPAQLYLNDIIADKQGRVLSGQEMFRDGEKYEPGFIFRLNLTGSTEVIDDGFHLANGMAFNDAGSLLYVADTIQRKIYRYKYEADGDLSCKTDFFELEKDYGMPDGMCVDNDGFIWIACFLGSRIIRIDPDGHIERQIMLPFAQPTSLCFGGKYNNVLFITSASFVWNTPLAPAGHSYTAHRGGELYAIETAVAGLPIHRAAIPLIF